MSELNGKGRHQNFSFPGIKLQQTSCYSKLQMHSNSHRLLHGLIHRDLVELKHFVVSELRTSALFVKCFVCMVIKKI